MTIGATAVTVAPPVGAVAANTDALERQQPDAIMGGRRRPVAPSRGFAATSRTGSPLEVYPDRQGDHARIDSMEGHEMKRIRRLVGCLAVALVLTAVATSMASATGRCGKLGSCAPTIGSVSASKVGERDATLTATINPDSLRTQYELWIEHAPCQGGAGECPKPVQKEKIGSGRLSASNRNKKVSEKVRDLSSGHCLYVYWFVASNGSGTAESAHENFTTKGGKEGPKECSR